MMLRILNLKGDQSWCSYSKCTLYNQSDRTSVQCTAVSMREASCYQTENGKDGPVRVTLTQHVDEFDPGPYRDWRKK